MVGKDALLVCKQIIEILYKKGVITRKEYDEIMETDIDDWQKMEQIIYNMEWKEDVRG